MTQQQNTRKALPPMTKERAPLTQAKGSGDSTNQKHRNRSKSKNKIPKSVRYDLENALVSLCDVWFEEIKPYLVRNNVKVHVHATGVTGATEAQVAGGDRDSRPTVAHACSHLDPASSASECELCQLLFNAANSIESAMSQASGATCPSPVLAVPDNFPYNTALFCSNVPHPRGTFETPRGSFEKPGLNGNHNPCRNCHETLKPKPRKHRRRKRNSYSHPAPKSAPVPRLCRTYSIPPDISHENSSKRYQASKESESKKYATDKKYDYSTKNDTKMKNKITQTEKKLNSEQKIESKTKLVRRHATTTFLPEPIKSSMRKGCGETFPLFKNDLIDIIVEKNDKRLQVLYTNLNKEENQSMMNLMPSPKTIQNEHLQKKPWK